MTLSDRLFYEIARRLGKAMPRVSHMELNQLWGLSVLVSVWG